MWDKLFDGLKNILTISVKVERHEKEIADLKTEVKNLTLQVSFLLSELRHATEQRDADRREIGLFI